MRGELEALKGVNLVEFLTQHYDLHFHRVGGQYVCHSPFTQEKVESFFVRLVNGHWLFKDFSSGHGGSIFDFVRIKENLASFSAVLSHIRGVLSPLCMAGWDGEGREDRGLSSHRGSFYDVNRLYAHFRGSDISVCRDYLLKRGICEELVNDLVKEGILVYNRYQGQSYCCFAVFNGEGELKCLDNHQVDGAGKFVLGHKSVFSRDWRVLATAERVFVCESIIDYLSVKTLEDDPGPGLALLGNQVSFDPSVVGCVKQIVSALDDDRGGYRAFLDLREQYPHLEIKVYDLEDYKDPNALLMAVKAGKGRKLSPERKLKLYHEFLQSSNRAEVARRWGVDRSYMYEIARECDRSVLDSFTGRKVGRKPEGRPSTLEEAWGRIDALEEQYERESAERELLYCRSEFLKLRLKWAEIEASELRGESVDHSKGALKKKQIKKKRKRRP
jgi:hypothetical protein